MHMWEKGLRKVILVGAILALAVPLIYSYSSMFHSTFLRGIAFEAIVIVMLGAWVALMAGSGRYAPDLKNPVVRGLLILAAATLITLPFAESVSASFWSNHIRMTGVFALLCFWLYALILHSVMKEAKEWRLLLVAAVEVAALVALYGIIEWMIGPGGYRMISTFGNPLYFAQYLLAATFLALALALTEKQKTKRWAFTFASAFFALTMLGTASRGAALGLFGGIIVFVILYSLGTIQNKRKRRLFIASILSVALFSIGGFFLLYTTEAGIDIAEKSPLIVKRLVMADFDDRLQIWEIAIQGWKEKPIFGHGYEQYLNVFNAHVEPGGKNYLLNESMFDRPHNFYLDVLVSTGLVGFAGFLVFYVFLFRFIVRLWRDEEKSRSTLAAFGGLFAAHLISVFFLFTTIGEFILLSLAIAYISKMNGHLQEKSDNRFDFQPWVLGFIALIVAVFIYQAQYMPLRSALLAEDAYRAIRSDGSQNAFRSALSDLRTAHANNTWISEKQAIRVAHLIRPITERIGFRSPELRELSQFLSAELAISAHENPNDYETALNASYAFRTAAEYFPAYVDQAILYAHFARGLGPGNPEPYEELGEIALLIDNYDEAEQWFNEALLRSRPHVEGGRIHYRLAGVLAFKGNMAEAFNHLALAEEQKYPIYHDARFVEALGEIALKDVKAVEPMLAYAEKTFENFPGQPYVLASAVKIYHMLGEAEKRDAALSMLMQLHPDLAKLLINEFEIGE